MKSRLWQRLLCLCGIALFLSFPRQSAEGIREGLRLSGAVLIPSLFPVSVLSCVLAGSASGSGSRLGSAFESVFRLPRVCLTVYLLGFLGGYPLGAQLTANLYADRQLSEREALRFSSFCNHPGPAFLIGTVGVGVFGSASIGMRLWIVQILASLSAALLLSVPGAACAQNRTDFTPAPGSAAVSLPAAISSCSASMLRLAGSVCFFRALLRCFETVLPIRTLPPLPLTVLSGLAELSGGVLRLGAFPAESAFLLAAALSAFGGFCVHLQALAAFSAARLSAGPYLRGKCLETALALLYAFALRIGSVPAIGICACIALFALPAFFFLFSAKKHWKSSQSVI